MTHVPTLGSGDVVGGGCSPKAARLDRARQAGLPVPPGAVVIDGTDFGAAARQVAAMFSSHGELGLAVRSAFAAEDGTTSSMAGHFHTALSIPPEAEHVEEAIAAVHLSGSATYRRDALIMPMVRAQHAGVAFLEPGWEDDLVNVVEGLGERLVSGAETGRRLRLPRLGRFERPNTGDDWSNRLQALLRDIRRTEGDHPLDIEWADDGTTCWLLQLRPITVAPQRDELFTLANHREILPDPPSVFMSSLIVANGQRMAGPGGLLEPALKHRSYFEMFDGRPYINQSLLTDFVRSLGLPSSLVNESLGGDDHDPAPLNPLRLAMSAPKLVRLGLSQMVAVQRARKVASRLANPPVEQHTTFGGAIGALADDHVALVDEMGNLVSAMAVPLAVLRRTGTLASHFANLDTPGTRIMSDLREVTRTAADLPGCLDVLADGTLPEHPEVHQAWQRWLRDHGHRGRFESDLSQPRFADDPAETLRLAASLPLAAPTHTPDTGWKQRLTLPLWLMGRRALVAREELRTQAMRGFHKHRLNLLEIAHRARDDGRLPAAICVWDLTIDELTQVDDGHIISAQDWADRQDEIAAHAAVDAPELRRRFGNIAEGSDPNGSGIPLFPGQVRGRAWVRDTPSGTLPDGFDPATTVLIARSVDAGWVPTFGLVAGVAVDIGGDLSHGSIILRELALPSITNTRGMTKQLATGDAVHLDATTGQLSRI